MLLSTLDITSLLWYPLAYEQRTQVHWHRLGGLRIGLSSFPAVRDQAGHTQFAGDGLLGPATQVCSLGSGTWYFVACKPRRVNGTFADPRTG